MQVFQFHCGALSGFGCKFGCITRPAHYLQRSDDILSMAFLAFFNSGESVLVSGLDLWFLQGLGRPLPSTFSRNPTDSWILRSIRQIILEIMVALS